MSDSLPLPPVDTRFTLGDRITPVQERFLEVHGFLHFEGVLNLDEVAVIKSELAQVESQWVDEGRTRVHGIPIFYGRRADGRRFVQRFAFASLFSKRLSEIIQKPRFRALLPLVGPDARIGEQEKDGVVVNRYLNEKGSIYKRLGWHTDGLRDLFYLRMPKKMLNVGLHLDAVGDAEGGLRLLPGTHTQGFFSMCFRKLYFLWHRKDKNEVCVQTKPGDLTVHDGRLWHRVAKAKMSGEASLRHSIYVPYITGAVELKGPESKTPAYHRLGVVMRGLKRPFVALLIAVGLAGSDAAAEPLGAGDLEGTFALRVEISHIVELPLLPDRINDGVNWILVEREHQGEGVYRQSSRVCRSRNGAVMGSSVQVRDAALRKMPLTRETVKLVPETGRYTSRGHVQLWGIRPVAAAYTADFPQSLEESKSPPFGDLIYDMDEDGVLGVAMHATGMSSGTLSGIQRKQFQLSGTAISADRILGLAVMEKESMVLSSTSRIISEGRYKKAVSSEDREASYFEEIRIPEGSTCQTVRGLDESGAFLEESPF